MTKSWIHRAARVAVVCTILTLAAISFSVFGSGSAHAMARQTASTGTTTYVRIVTDQRYSVFSPSAITVTSGTTVKITNRTASELEVRTSSPQLFYNLNPGESFTVNPTQSEYVRVCGGYGGLMNITVS